LVSLLFTVDGFFAFIGESIFAARNQVTHALATGRLCKPMFCERCGEVTRKLDSHHHRGYSRRHALDVIFVCRRCHAKEHGGFGSRTKAELKRQ
jgi:hypothetical protein